KFPPRDRKSEHISAVGSDLGMQLEAVGNRRVGRDHGVSRGDLPLCGSQRDAAVPLGNFFDWAIGKEADAVRLTNRHNSSKVLQRMEGRLPGITKNVAAFNSLAASSYPFR